MVQNVISILLALIVLTTPQVTGDNLQTAVQIAKECGILTERGQAMEGPEFRRLSVKELDKASSLRIPRLHRPAFTHIVSSIYPRSSRACRCLPGHLPQTNTFS